MEPSFDPEVLYHTNTEWIALGKNVELIRDQLEQAKQDIDMLQQLKEEAMEDPETFLKHLQSGDIRFPRMQSIAKIPELDLTKYSKKTSRRGNSKYEQNLEFLLAKAQELHKRTSVVPPVLLSTSIAVSAVPSPGPVASLAAPVRERFYEIAGYPNPLRSGSAPAPSYSDASHSGAATPFGSPSDSGPEAAEGAHLQPKPQRVHRVSLVENGLVASHYNLPWSEEEKRRFDELLVVYPEEEVNSRRYAKIAQALGTRTATQVSNRLHKMSAKKVRHAKRDAELARQQANRLLKTLQRSGVSVDETDEDDFILNIDDEKKLSDDFQEYMKLKGQLDEIKAQVIEHAGFKCDGCTMEPIIGIRHHCTSCTADFDLCHSCMSSVQHDPTHAFAKVTTASAKPAGGE